MNPCLLYKLKSKDAEQLNKYIIRINCIANDCAKRTDSLRVCNQSINFN